MSIAEFAINNSEILSEYFAGIAKKNFLALSEILISTRPTDWPDDVVGKALSAAARLPRGYSHAVDVEGVGDFRVGSIIRAEHIEGKGYVNFPKKVMTLTKKTREVVRLSMIVKPDHMEARLAVRRVPELSWQDTYWDIVSYRGEKRSKGWELVDTSVQIERP